MGGRLAKSASCVESCVVCVSHFHCTEASHVSILGNYVDESMNRVQPITRIPKMMIREDQYTNLTRPSDRICVVWPYSGSKYCNQDTFSTNLPCVWLVPKDCRPWLSAEWKKESKIIIRAGPQIRTVVCRNSSPYLPPSPPSFRLLLSSAHIAHPDSDTPTSHPSWRLFYTNPRLCALFSTRHHPAPFALCPPPLTILPAEEPSRIFNSLLVVVLS